MMDVAAGLLEALVTAVLILGAIALVYAAGRWGRNRGTGPDARMKALTAASEIAVIELRGYWDSDLWDSTTTVTPFPPGPVRLEVPARITTPQPYMIEVFVDGKRTAWAGGPGGIYAMGGDVIDVDLLSEPTWTER